MDRVLEVRLGGQRAGALLLKDNGNMQFRYEAGYVGPAISVAMPVRHEAYPHRDCEAWFGGLLPEGDVRDALARALGTSSSNQFRILNEIGGDCAGAIEIVPEEWTARAESEPEELTLDELDEVIARLPQRPLGVDPEAGIRMSLAGAQPKLPVIFEPTQYEVSGFALPRGPKVPTTHLLKPEPDRFPGLVENEFFCMTLARNCGLDVAYSDALTTPKGRNCLIVRRYDRSHDDQGNGTRIHQEDFCQATLTRSENKYQEDGGPTFRDLSDLLRRESRNPAQDVFRLWDAAVFNWAVGNCDAHAKNFSLLHDGRAPVLAPLYDLVSTMAYPELSSRWAMTIGGARFDDEVDFRAWSNLAREMRLSPRAALERAIALLEAIKRTAAQMFAIERFSGTAPSLIGARIDGLRI